jgi:hypothetical protein
METERQSEGRDKEREIGRRKKEKGETQRRGAVRRRKR